ncbi:MAG TPA: amidohydrolase [Chloroflexia bacterium]
MTPANSATTPEIVLIHNARIYTMDHHTPQAEAIAIREGKVVAVGGTRELGDMPGITRRIDAGGRAIIPGLIDAHIHFLAYARSLALVNLDGVRSKDEALRMVAEKVAQLEPGRWVIGGGWNNNLWSLTDYPTRYDLDRIAPQNPVYLDRKDLHSCWVNSLALQRAGVTRDTPVPPGAAIGKDEAGEPNGMLYESATAIVRNAIDESRGDAREAMRDGFRVLTGMGLVGFHSPEGPDAFHALQELDAAGELKMRIVHLLAYYRLDETIRVGLRTGFGSERLRTGPVKIFSDGSLGSMTAQMLAPFEGTADNYGLGTIPQDEMEDAIVRAAEAGISCAIHAIGDAANRRVLDAFEKAHPRLAMLLPPDMPHRIEHAQLVHPDDMPRFARLGVVASMQPIHATSDMHAADRLWGARSRYGYAWRSLLNAGARLAFGSDAPVETPNPFAGIHAAVTRQDADDQPEGGWYPEERLTVEEAVRAYTEWAALSAPYLPNVTGTLTPGSVADLLVLDRDIFRVDPGEIKHTRPLATLIGGEPVFDPDGMFDLR